jgi:hypothetical protein
VDKVQKHNSFNGLPCHAELITFFPIVVVMYSDFDGFASDTVGQFY